MKGVKIFPSEVKSCLAGIDGIKNNYRLIISTRESGLDSIKLLIHGTSNQASLEQIHNRFKTQTLVTPDILEISEEWEEGPILIDQRRKSDG